eukprot:TRINITY_DN20565_c0_g1_i2.p1 TRINITY_DN20565_c0_g1~~TRINITY_DN20565_c0_g1_i2.p1  ORF type:complete len:181 (+),score=35.93 TRINITY_DN20565_c0_g1_i2:73-615(+)
MCIRDRYNPEFSAYMLPHSCGRPCGRMKHPWCNHGECNVLCHPGHCEPCQETVELSCFCGREKKMMQCTMANTKFSCGKKCRKLLSCGKHHCEEMCHEKGMCKSCEIVVKARCYCGKEERVVKCGNEHFDCANICGAKLSCGLHTCNKFCHAGECGNCELLPSTVPVSYTHLTLPTICSV